MPHGLYTLWHIYLMAFMVVADPIQEEGDRPVHLMAHVCVAHIVVNYMVVAYAVMADPIQRGRRSALPRDRLFGRCFQK